jgi:hypothetical protein
MQPAEIEIYHERLLDERQALVSQRGRILETIPEEIHPPGENEVLPSEGIDVEMSLDQAVGFSKDDIHYEMEGNGCVRTSARLLANEQTASFSRRRMRQRRREEIDDTGRDGH